MDKGSPSETPKRDQLREEAALWFVRMRGAEASLHRASFEAWLARGAMHRGAYNRVAETFSIGKGLSDPDAERDADPPKASKGDMVSRTAILVGTLIIALIAGWALLAGNVLTPGRSDAPLVAEQTKGTPASPLQLATVLGEIRTFRLADGSSVTLDTNSLVTVAYGATTRRLRLERGRARFKVAHDGRSFIVAAGDGSVTARGTIFDVGLDTDNGVMVRLIRGSVDVVMPTSARPPARSPMKRTTLTPGEQISFGGNGTEAPPPGGNMTWPQAIVEFDHARLGDVVAEANRYSAVRIRLEGSDIVELKVSGRFRITNTHELAQRLAILFGLTLDATNATELVLRKT